MTREEVSVVLENARYQGSSVPAAAAAAGSTIKVEDGWRIIKVEGPLDFSLLGILSRLATTLCEAGVSIFVISTYDTDYLMVKENDLEAAVLALKSAGHTFKDTTPAPSKVAQENGSGSTNTSSDVAGFEPFQLERYFARHEFSAPHLLCCSDIQPWSQKELFSWPMTSARSYGTTFLSATLSLSWPLLRQEIAGMYDGCETSDVLLTVPEEGIYIACRALLNLETRWWFLGHATSPYPRSQVPLAARSCDGSQTQPRSGSMWMLFDVLVDDTTRLVVVNFPHNPTGRPSHRTSLIVLWRFVPGRMIAGCSQTKCTGDLNTTLLPDSPAWRL